MKKDLTEIVFILDESGSMNELRSDTTGGFNSLIEKQKNEPGEAVVSTVLFNTQSRVLHDRVPIGKVGKMTSEDYCPGGCTALLDAVGSAVKHISNVHKYAREEDVPEHTLFVITTDGMENASRVYSRAKVKEMIKEREERGWEFIFLGANIDSPEFADSIGIESSNAVDYDATCEGTGVLYEAICCAVSEKRAGNTLSAKSCWRSALDKRSKK